MAKPSDDNVPAKQGGLAEPFDGPAVLSPAEVSPSKEPGDLSGELKRLNQMRKDGLLTDSEYSDLRKSAIEKEKAR